MVKLHVVWSEPYTEVAQIRSVFKSRKQCPCLLPRDSYYLYVGVPWWRHQMKTFSALLAIWAGNSPVTGEFPAQRPLTQSFGVFFDLRLNKRLSKQSWGWLFEPLSRPLWRHCNVLVIQSSCQTHLAISTVDGVVWLDYNVSRWSYYDNCRHLLQHSHSRKYMYTYIIHLFRVHYTLSVLYYAIVFADQNMRFIYIYVHIYSHMYGD